MAVALPRNMDITALARATHRRTHARTHTWGKYNQTPLKCTHACALQVCSLRALHEGNIRAQAGAVDVSQLIMSMLSGSQCSLKLLKWQLRLRRLVLFKVAKVSWLCDRKLRICLLWSVSLG